MNINQVHNGGNKKKNYFKERVDGNNTIHKVRNIKGFVYLNIDVLKRQTWQLPFLNIIMFYDSFGSWNAKFFKTEQYLGGLDARSKSSVFCCVFKHLAMN